MNLVSASHWASGRLSGVERVASAAGPVLLLISYFGVAGAWYLIRHFRRAPFLDEEIARRTGGVLGARGIGHFFAWTMQPWWRVLAHAAFPPNVITSLSLVLALGAGLAAADGRFALGGWLFVLAGVLDFLDGRVARSTGRTTLAGAALDSVLDRYVESALLAGLAWYYRHSWVLLACLLALTGSLLVPYVRARAESLGVAQARVGFMQRPERVALLGLGTALSPILEVLLAPNEPHPPHRLAIAVVVLLGITSHATALQRLYGLIHTLSAGAEGHLEQPLRVAVSNALATLADFAIATSLAYLLGVYAPLATIAGCVFGALVAFVVARIWAFESTEAWLPQLGRYASVSLATAALNGGGVALLLSLNAPFLLAWWCTRIVVFATWSYPLQRDFVFAAAPVLRAEATVGPRG